MVAAITLCTKAKLGLTDRAFCFSVFSTELMNLSVSVEVCWHGITSSMFAMGRHDVHLPNLDTKEFYVDSVAFLFIY